MVSFEDLDTICLTRCCCILSTQYFAWHVVSSWMNKWHSVHPQPHIVSLPPLCYMLWTFGATCHPQCSVPSPNSKPQLLLLRIIFHLSSPTTLIRLGLALPSGFHSTIASSGKPPIIFHQPNAEKYACVSVVLDKWFRISEGCVCYLWSGKDNSWQVSFPLTCD